MSKEFRNSPYSFSKINTYELCPLKFKFQYLDKLGIFQRSLATERGSFIHLLLENHTKDKKTKFKFHIATEEQQKECFDIFVKFLDSKLGQKYMVKDAEAEVHFGIKKTMTGFETCSYYDKEALFRGKIDQLILKDHEALIGDYKTGKISLYPAPLQLLMYVIWAFYEYPELEEINTSFIYVEHDKEKLYKFTRKHLFTALKKVLEKIITIENDKVFEKKEGPLCDYCDFRAAGLCLPETNDEFEDKMMKFNPK